LARSIDFNLFRRRAFAWIGDHLDAFDPFVSQRSYEIRNGQRIGELAILLKCYVGLTGDRESLHVHRILALLRAVQANPVFADRLLRYPAEFILFVQLYACLRVLGFEESEKRAAIERALDANYLGQTERLPHRMMDIASCLECGGFATHFPTLPELYLSSILTPVPFAAHLNEDAVYAITHVIMFLYDFGLRDNLAVPSEDRGALADCLSALLVAACHEHHWDMLAELLVCWDCVGLAHGFIYERSWQALGAVQRADGAVPGPEWAQREHDAAIGMRTPDGERLFDIAHHYHTTLVSVIAGCLREKRMAASLTPADGLSSRREQRSQRRAASPAVRELFAESLTRANLWLDAVLAQSLVAEPVRTEVLCRLVLAIWICCSRTAVATDKIATVASEVGERLGFASDWSQTPLVLQLMAALLVAANGVRVPYLHDSEGLVAYTASSLVALTDDELCADPNLVPVRLLLHAMNRATPPLALDVDKSLDQIRQFSLAASNAEIECLLSTLEALTAHGTRPVALGPDCGWLADLLACFATTMLRKYDLILGCRILRLMRYLNLSHSLTAPCLAFLIMQQRDSGCFGLFGPEASFLPVGASVATMLELPVTVECVWTFAEVGGWCLYDAL
jgi:hypothetical protein